MRRLNNSEERHAQDIACSHLIKGCEGAISELEAAAGETSGLPRTKKRAQEILAHVLSSWRQARSGLAPSEESLHLEANMDDWTTDELFGEALARRAGDRPALREMQGMTLQAQLTAHDDE